MKNPGVGLSVALDNSPYPFACVIPGALIDEGFRDWQLARWCCDQEEAGGDELTDEVHVSEEDTDGEPSQGSAGMHLLPALLNRRLASIQRKMTATDAQSEAEGLWRGPNVRVGMDKKKVYGGLMKMDIRGLELESHSEFVTVRSRSGVSSGCWMYEVTIHTVGLQQVGWVTSLCQMSDFVGVGDTPMSIAFDGSRALRWSGKEFAHYGKPWVPGDVVGCILDLDMGAASFYLNGENLGTAYDRQNKIRCGQGVVYYPCVSLAYAQRSTLNFGHLPFDYPLIPHFTPTAAPQTLRSPPAAPSAANSSTHAPAASRSYRSLEKPVTASDVHSAQYLAASFEAVCRATVSPALIENTHHLLDLCDKIVCRPADMDNAASVATPPERDPPHHPSASPPTGPCVGAARDRRREKVWASGFAPSDWAVLAASAVGAPLLQLLRGGGGGHALEKAPTAGGLAAPPTHAPPTHAEPPAPRVSRAPAAGGKGGGGVTLWGVGGATISCT